MLEPNVAASPQSNTSLSGRTIKRSEKVIRWIEANCVIPEGADVGKTVRLRDWQKDIIRKIYDNPHGTRRAIISFGRKNAKTTLSAFLLLAHLCGPEARRNSQLFSAAQSREQAAIIFELAAKIVRQSPTMAPPRVTIRDTAKQLLFPALGTFYRALSAEASTAYGFSPVFVVHDELGQVKGPRSPLYEALETAAGAQADPLSIIISTQAPTDADLLSVLLDDAQRGSDQRVVCSLYTAPIDHAEPFGRDAVALANPALGDFLNEQETMATAADAQRMPSREAEYRNLILNQRVEASAPFVSRSAWAVCGDEPKSLDGIPVYGGLDLSAVNDLTALVLIGRVEGVWQVDPAFWLPGDGLADKARKDSVPYDVWANQGKLLTAPGKSVDYEYVAEYLVGVFSRYDLRKVGFDRWGMQHLRPWLLKAGLTEEFIDERFVDFGQGTKSMTPALRVLEGEILNKRIAHGNHPVLAMCAANAVVEGKDESCRKLSKAKSSGRIDGMVALTMAMGVAPLENDRPPEYQMIFV